MKTFNIIIFAICSLFLLSASPQKSIDLDGDGKPDQIMFEGKPDDNVFTIIVNDVRYEGKGNYICGMYEIADIDSTDGVREIAIPERGPSDDYATAFLLYNQDKIREIGKIPGAGNMMCWDGSGIIHTMVRGSILHTWFFPAAFVLDKKHTLHMAEQQLYPMNIPKIGFTGFSRGANCTAKRNFPLQASPADSTIIRTMTPGEKFTIVASDNKRWCVVQTSVGTWGWFEIRNGVVLPAGVRPLELMDGLCMAD